MFSYVKVKCNRCVCMGGRERTACAWDIMILFFAYWEHTLFRQ